MTEKRVDVKVRAQAEGFEKVGAAAKKAMDATSPPKDSKQKHEDLEKGLTRAAKAAERVSKALSDRKVADGLRAMAMEAAFMARETTKAADALEKLARKQKMTGAVTGAVVGGAVSGGFGGAAAGGWLGSHMGGRTGGALGGVIGGLGARTYGGVSGAMSMPFTGMQGLQQSLGAIPFVGAFAQGQLGAAMAAAQQALAVQGARYSMNPFLGPGSAQASAFTAAGTAVSRARAEGRFHVTAGMADPSAPNVSMAARASNLPRMNPRTGMMTNTGLGTTTPEEGNELLRYRIEKQTADRINAQRGGDLKRQRTAGDAAAHTYRMANDPLYFLKETGTNFGMDESTALGNARQFYGARGGYLSRELRTGAGQAQYQAALSAQGQYGIGMGTSGQFARGGLSGAGDPGLEKTIRDGMRLGLQGSDLEKYTESMAERLRNFETTGIPVASTSLVQLQAGLAGTFGGIRAQSMASGILNKAQGVGINGPQNSAEFLMLRKMGGYNGGGIDDWMAAKRRLEQGGNPGGLQEMIRGVSQLNTPGGNSAAIQGLFRNLGQTMTSTDAFALAGGDPDALKRWSGVLARGGADEKSAPGLDGVTGQASAAMQRQSRITNETAGLGQSVLPSMQNMEQLSTSMLKNFTTFSKELNEFTGWSSRQTAAMAPTFQKAEQLLDSLLTWLEAHR